MVTLAVPAGVLAAVLIVSVLLTEPPPAVMVNDDGLKEQDAPAGRLEQVNCTVPEYPPCGFA